MIVVRWDDDVYCYLNVVVVVSWASLLWMMVMLSPYYYYHYCHYSYSTGMQDR
jgi:hypothetical protein